MDKLSENCTELAQAIVQGAAPAVAIKTAYPHYSSDIAMEIYRNNYRGNLQDALAGAYPVIRQLVGDEFFRFIARKFIEQHPSRDVNLYHYGAEWADFVGAFLPARELVYLSDVAALEWAYHCAYFAPEASVLSLERLVEISVEHYPYLILHVHPACRVLRSVYPIGAIWQAHQPGENSNFQIDLACSETHILVSRHANVVQVSELLAADALWLEQIQCGVTLGDATARSVERYPDFDLQACLHKLFLRHVLTQFELAENR